MKENGFKVYQVSKFGLYRGDFVIVENKVL